MADSKPHPSEVLEFTTAAHLASNHSAENQEEKPATSNEAPRAPSHDGSPYQHMPRRGSVVETAAQKDHRMNFTQASRLYPKAIGWSFMIFGYHNGRFRHSSSIQLLCLSGVHEALWCAYRQDNLFD